MEKQFDPAPQNVSPPEEGQKQSAEDGQTADTKPAPKKKEGIGGFVVDVVTEVVTVILDVLAD